VVWEYRITRPMANCSDLLCRPPEARFSVAQLGDAIVQRERIEPGRVLRETTQENSQCQPAS